jgi:tetratricopeptide (TPR) repeat protein
LVADYQSGLGGALNNLALLFRERGELNEARRLLERAIGYEKSALQANPRHPTYRLFLRNHYVALAETFLRLKEHSEAARAAEAMAGTRPENATDAYTGVCQLARCILLAQQDDKLTDEERVQGGRSYADRAMRLLRVSIEQGFHDAEHVKTNSDLDPLRSREDFQALLAQLEEKRQDQGAQR